MIKNHKENPIDFFKDFAQGIIIALWGKDNETTLPQRHIIYRKNNNISITKSGKDGGIVIMDKKYSH